MMRFVIGAVAALWAATAQAEIAIQEVTSPGGVEAWLVEDPSIPFVALEIRIIGGANLDRPGKRGAINLMTGLLEEGSGDLTAREFQAAREGLAAYFGYDVRDDTFVLSFQALSENRDEAVELFRQSIIDPTFEPDAIERVRAQVIAGIESDAQSPNAIAGDAFFELAFPGHPYGSDSSGTIESVSALTRDDLVQAHRDVLVSDGVYVAAVGDITPAELGVLIDRLIGDLPPAPDGDVLTYMSAQQDYSGTLQLIADLEVSIADMGPRPQAEPLLALQEREAELEVLLADAGDQAETYAAELAEVQTAIQETAVTVLTLNTLEQSLADAEAERNRLAQALGDALVANRGPLEVPFGLGGGVTVIDYPTPQSVALFGHEGIERDDEDFFAAYILNHILGGGGFESRLMQEVRERRGLTYGISTFLVPKDYAEMMLGSVASSNETVAEAIEVIRSEWERIATEGVTEAELEAAKTYLTGEYPLRFDGNGPIAEIMVAMQVEGLPVDYIQNRNDYVNAVTLDDIARVAAELMQADDLHFVVVGQPVGLE